MADESNQTNTDIAVSSLTLKVGVVSGFLTYLVFMFLDFFALPEHYKLSWLIRIGAIIIVALGSLVFIKKRPIATNMNLYFTMLIFGGNLGILAIISIATPAEVAYWTYYFGLIIMILWAGLIFQLSMISMTFLTSVSFVGYNVIAIFFQNLLANEDTIAIFIANEFFLSAASVLAIVGSSELKRYKIKIMSQHQSLKRENMLYLDAKKKAEEADRLKTSFLANMSHEIRTPLNAIVGFAHMLGDSDLTDDERLKFTDIIDLNADQLLTIINDIVDIAKIEGEQMMMNIEDVDIDHIIENCALNFEILKKQSNREHLQVNIFHSQQDAKVFVSADYFRLTQVFTNLLSNALKFTEQGMVSFGVYKINVNEVTMYVKDTGIGIETDKLKAIFSEFIQEDQTIATRFGGTGLGLSITKRLLELMNGSIRVETIKGEGTTFFFTLPRN